MLTNFDTIYFRLRCLTLLLSDQIREHDWLSANATARKAVDTQATLIGLASK